MHVRCDNQYKTGADRGNISGQPMLFECVGICVLSPAHGSEMRGHSMLAWTALSWNFWGILKNIFRGVCGTYHL